MFDEIVPVVENRPLTGGHFLLSLRAPRQAQATRPGQFAMLRLLGRSDVLLRRPMSIYDVKSGSQASLCRPDVVLPAKDKRWRPRSHKIDKLRALGSSRPELIQLLYKIVGRGTRLMADLKPGNLVGLLAPLGHGFLPEEYMACAREVDEVLQVAGGIGIAALLLPARDLAGAGIRQRLFFGGRTQWDLVGVEDFAPLVKTTALATEDGSRGYRGFITQPVGQYLSKHPNRKFLIMVCGPWAMLHACVELAKQYNHPCLVSMENRMGCALGVCLGCCIRVVGEGHAAYQRVCTEGPVFWAERVVWEKEDLPRT